jgi:hypothetical protein
MSVENHELCRSIDDAGEGAIDGFHGKHLKGAATDPEID